MSFAARAKLNETAARKVAGLATRSEEVFGASRDAIRETHEEFWHGEVPPEALLEEMGTDAAEAIGTHWATVQWVAAVTALRLPPEATAEERAAASNAVIAAHAPLRELTPHPDGTVTVAPITPPEE